MATGLESVENWVDIEEAKRVRKKDKERFFEMQYQEACDRLRVLTNAGLHPNVLSDFEQDGELNYSERSVIFDQPVGALYCIDDENFGDVVRRFNNKYDCVVYHATHERTEFGELLDLFYVSTDPEEWELDRADLIEHRPVAYVANLTDNICSEFGTIEFGLVGGGIVRTM